MCPLEDLIKQRRAEIGGAEHEKHTTVMKQWLILVRSIDGSVCFSRHFTFGLIKLCMIFKSSSDQVHHTELLP